MTQKINDSGFSLVHTGRPFVITALLIAMFSSSVFAKVKTADSPLPKILSLYYDVKNALVASDAATASKKAGELLTAVNGINASSLTPEESKIFTPLKDKLSYDARHISEVQDISHQREHFAALSLNMFTLAKGAKISGDPVYQDYCPMQKAYWLSKEAEIKNPYYGSQMLTCGKVTATIKQ